MEITKSSPASLDDIFSSNIKQYRVPAYQRHYRWEEVHHEELWTDILTSLRLNHQYFMGPLVLTAVPGNNALIDIVDGQQRLATFTIVYSCIRDYLNTYLDDPGILLSEIPSDATTRNRAKKTHSNCEAYLSHNARPNIREERYMILNEHDDAIFFTFIQQTNGFIVEQDLIKPAANKSRIIKARWFFLDKVFSEIIKPNPSDAIKKLQLLVEHISINLLFLPIEVKDDGDAYQLFESLNSKGENLSGADLIKNRVMALCKTNKSKKSRVLSMWDEL